MTVQTQPLSTTIVSPPFILPGFNVLLMGPSGTGKTFAIGTLVDSGLEVFYLAMESGFESLAGYWTDRGLPIPDNLHWHRLAPAEADLTSMIAAAEKVNLLPMDALTKIQDPNKGLHNQFVKLLRALNDFPDDRTGGTFGPVNKWDQTRALVIDGMTGVSNAAMSLVTGAKPTRTQPEWGVAQGQVLSILRLICDGCECHFVLIGHVEREQDAILGGVKLMISTLGKAIAPTIPTLFSDVILTERTGDKWTWNTASMMADVKSRNLPIKADIAPTFKAIVDKWVSRNKTGEVK